MSHKTLTAGMVALTAVFATPARGESLQDVYDRVSASATMNWRGQPFAPVLFFNGRNAAEDIRAVIDNYFSVRVQYDPKALWSLNYVMSDRLRRDPPYTLRVFLDDGTFKHGRLCMVRTPEAAFNLRHEVNAYFGLTPQTTPRPKHPYMFFFAIPPRVTQEAWNEFKTHFAASMCVKRMPEPLEKRNYFVDEFNANLFPVIFAAVMTARAGYPEIIPFLADMHAGLFKYSDGYAHLQDRAVVLSGDQARSSEIFRSDRLFQVYPSFALDALAKEWDSWKNVAPADIFAKVDAFATKYTFSDAQYWTLNDLRMGKSEHPRDDILAEAVAARETLATAHLNLHTIPLFQQSSLKP
jgi:hypothetical protein